MHLPLLPVPLSSPRAASLPELDDLLVLVEDVVRDRPALDLALELAAQAHLEIDLVGLLRPGEPGAPPLLPASRDADPALHLRRRLQSLASSMAPCTEVRVSIVDEPALELIEAAEESVVVVSDALFSTPRRALERTHTGLLIVPVHGRNPVLDSLVEWCLRVCRSLPGAAPIAHPVVRQLRAATLWGRARRRQRSRRRLP